MHIVSTEQLQSQKSLQRTTRLLTLKGAWREQSSAASHHPAGCRGPMCHSGTFSIKTGTENYFHIFSSTSSTFSTLLFYIPLPPATHQMLALMSLQFYFHSNILRLAAGYQARPGTFCTSASHLFLKAVVPLEFMFLSICCLITTRTLHFYCL